MGWDGMGKTCPVCPMPFVQKRALWYNRKAENKVLDRIFATHLELFFEIDEGAGQGLGLLLPSVEKNILWCRASKPALPCPSSPLRARLPYARVPGARNPGPPCTYQE